MCAEHGDAERHLENIHREIRAIIYPGADAEHLQPPLSILPEHALAESDDAAALEIVANAYFDTMSDTRYAQLTDRVAALRENDIANTTGKPPAITVCMPVAAMGESEQTIAHTLQLVAKQAGAESAELLVYANYNANTTDQAQIASRQAMLARLQAGAMQSEHPLRVRYVLEGYPGDELSISRVRKDAADMVALDILERGGGYQHPILWLDADNTHLTPGLLTAHIDQQQANGRDLVLTTTQNYFSMNDPGHEYQPGSTAQKLAVYNEILRRHALHRTPDIKTDPYPQENGLSFSIGTYLLAGGFNTSIKLEEARQFQVVVTESVRTAQAVLGYTAMAHRTELPPHLRVYSSGRRHIEHAQQHLTQERLLRKVDERTETYAVYDNAAFSGPEDDTIRRRNISRRIPHPASTPDQVRQHVHAITSEYRPKRPADPSEAAYFAFASRIIERLGLTELAEITEVTPSVRPW